MMSLGCENAEVVRRSDAKRPDFHRNQRIPRNPENIRRKEGETEKAEDLKLSLVQDLDPTATLFVFRRVTCE